MVTINIHDRLLPDASDLDVFIKKVACILQKGGLLNVIGKEIQETIKEVTELRNGFDRFNSIKKDTLYI
jgi:hypothetical protein